MIAQFSEKLDLKLIFKDVGVSSSRSQVERKLDEVRRLLDLYPILIVTELSRLGRSTVEVLGLLEEMLTKGVAVVCLREGFLLEIDSKNPFANLQIAMISAFAQMEREICSLRMKHALAMKRGRGERLVI